jgi:microcompartment protein CcmK/EutM
MGAGIDEVVLYASGSSARMTKATDKKPCDAVVMAIVDVLEVGGDTLYLKNPGHGQG